MRLQEQRQSLPGKTEKKEEKKKAEAQGKSDGFAMKHRNHTYSPECTHADTCTGTHILYIQHTHTHSSAQV